MIKPHRILALGTIMAAFLLAMTSPAAAQSFSFDFGDGGSSTGRIVQMVVLLTVLSLAPSILVMATSFTRIIVVLWQYPRFLAVLESRIFS